MIDRQEARSDVARIDPAADRWLHTAIKFDPDLVVEAIDADKTSHVTYSIISGNNEGLFSVEPNLGKIRISSNKGLDVSNDTDNIILLTIMVRRARGPEH
jgi:hypothetical protein